MRAAGDRDGGPDGVRAARRARAYHELVAVKRRLPEWLLYRLDPYNTSADRFIAEAARSVAPGACVLDAGAGECRHGPLFRHAHYLGTDSGVGEGASWDYSGLDFRSNLTTLPLRDAVMDAVLSVNVLEHVAEPAAVLLELRRVLRPGGRLYLVAPQSWPLHQAPHDYFRFTRHALQDLLQRTGFEPLLLAPVGGGFWALGLRSLYLLAGTGGRSRLLAALLAPVLGVLVPLLCFYLDGLDRGREDTLGHQVIAVRDPADVREAG